MASDVSIVKSNIKNIYSRKKKLALAVCLQYAGMALEYFRNAQSGAKFWNNQTGIARDTVFSGVITESDTIGFFLAHLQEYGVYLELANNRKNEALKPSVFRFYSRFIRDLENVYGGDV